MSNHKLMVENKNTGDKLFAVLKELAADKKFVSIEYIEPVVLQLEYWEKSQSSVNFQDMTNFLTIKIKKKGKSNKNLRNLFPFQLNYVMAKVYGISVRAFDKDCICYELPKAELLTDSNATKAKRLLNKRLGDLQTALIFREKFRELLEAVFDGFYGAKARSVYVERGKKPLFDFRIRLTPEALQKSSAQEIADGFKEIFNNYHASIRTSVNVVGFFLVFKFTKPLNIHNNVMAAGRDLNNALYGRVAIDDHLAVEVEASRPVDTRAITWQPKKESLRGERRPTKREKPTRIKIREQDFPGFFSGKQNRPQSLDNTLSFNGKEFDLLVEDCVLKPLYHAVSKKPIAFVYWSLSSDDVPDHFINMLQEDKPMISNRAKGKSIHQVFQKERKLLFENKIKIFQKPGGDAFPETSLRYKLHTYNQDRVYLFYVGMAEVTMSDGKTRAVEVVTASSIDFKSHKSSTSNITIAEMDGLDALMPEQLSKCT